MDVALWPKYGATQPMDVALLPKYGATQPRDVALLPKYGATQPRGWHSSLPLLTARLNSSFVRQLIYVHSKLT